jgi:hypothetical protein
VHEAKLGALSQHVRADEPVQRGQRLSFRQPGQPRRSVQRSLPGQHRGGLGQRHRARGHPGQPDQGGGRDGPRPDPLHARGGFGIGPDLIGSQRRDQLVHQERRSPGRGPACCSEAAGGRLLQAGREHRRHRVLAQRPGPDEAHEGLGGQLRPGLGIGALLARAGRCQQQDGPAVQAPGQVEQEPQ